MEQLLTIWVDDLNQKRIPLAQRAIAAKVMSLSDIIQQKEGGNETFTASKGWFARFKQRSQIHCIKFSGEAASANIKATRAFTAEFKKIIEDNDFPSDFVFNVDETGLYWKVTVRNLYLDGRKIGAWLQGIQGPTYTSPWRERIRNSKTEAITGLSFRNSQSNERHSKISFASQTERLGSHNRFSQNGILSTLAVVFQSKQSASKGCSVA